MKAIGLGEVWIVSLAGEPRDVTVIASASPGWWRCVDVQTGIAFAASERWFVDRVREPHCRAQSPDD
jgi:hypothetical protein